jgi:hypothetical protein
VHEAQVGQDVAHLLAVEERHSADEDVRHGADAELLLEGPRLRLRAEQHREVGVARLLAAHELADLARDRVGLAGFVLAAQHEHRLAGAERRAQLLRMPPGLCSMTRLAASRMSEVER